MQARGAAGFCSVSHHRSVHCFGVRSGLEGEKMGRWQLLEEMG